MRSEVLRLYKTIHSWTGIVSGMLLFVCFYAGALTVFAEPIGRWATPPARGAATIAGADELIAATLAARPDAAKDFSLYLAADGASGAARLAQEPRGRGQMDGLFQ